MEDLSFSGSWFGAVAFWLFVFLATIFTWALPIHFGARLVIDGDGWIMSRAQASALDGSDWKTLRERVREHFGCAIRWIPRFLGLAPFVALATAILFGVETDKGASALREGPATLWQARFLLVADFVAAGAYLGIVTARRRWVDRMLHVQQGGRLLVAMGYGCGLLTALFFVAAYAAPIPVSALFPRALLIPPLFGSLVLLLCQLQRISHRVGMPLVLPLIALAALVTAANAPLHALRTLPRVPGGQETRLTMDDGVSRWLAANGCRAAETCNRRPLVVAIDGGASRAAFTAATFIGALLDRMPSLEGEAATPGRRVFAISGVSGGAFGAAVFQAALADAQVATSSARIPPCRTADRTWFGYAYRSRANHDFRWQECLQALVSGDFLSPTILGLAFRDYIAPQGSIEDRAVLLEQSWERHYDQTVTESSGVFGEVCGTATERGLCRRMAHPKTFLDEHANSWIPLLLLNGTSVRTGRRVIASDIAATPVAKDIEPLFAEAYDLSEVLSSPCEDTPVRSPLEVKTATDINQSASAIGKTVRTNEHGVCGGARRIDGDDVRLSTAALASARFPLISPAGAFSMKNAPFGDQVVDGGYFENSGLTTALEIVIALERAHLKPLLVSIANEPAEADADAVQEASATTRAGLPKRPSTTPLTVYPKNGFFARIFGSLRAPFTTLIATRDGHASESEGRAEAHLAPADFFRIHVDQDPDLRPIAEVDPYDAAYCTAIWTHQDPKLSMAKVSMSWWLSALVQADLDAQKCSRGNQTKMNALMKALSAT